MLQVLFPGLGYKDWLNKASSFWAFLCPSWCKPWMLAKADWKDITQLWENLIFLGRVGVKALPLPPLCAPNLARDFFEWHEKQPAGCESPPFSSFLTFKIRLAKTQHSPPPASIYFALLFSWLRLQMKEAFLPSVRGAFAWQKKFCTYVGPEQRIWSFPVLTRFCSRLFRDPLEFFFFFLP